MSKRVFFGQVIDLDDTDQITPLILTPAFDAYLVLHALTCANHGEQPNPDGKVSLLAEEARAVSFLIPYWCGYLPIGVVEKLIPEEFYNAMSHIDSAAIINTGVELNTYDAGVVCGVLVALNTAIVIYNNTVGFIYGEEES